MKAEALSFYQSGWLSGIGLLLFLALFIGILFWVFRKSSAELYTKIAAIPLDESSEGKNL